MYSKIINIVLIFGVFPTIYTQVGDRCRLPINNKPGVCKSVLDCPSVRTKIAVGIQPTICGTVNNLRIVCCEDKNAPTRPNLGTANNKRISKSEQKCKEYTKSVVAVDYALPLSVQSSLVTYETANCDYNGVPLIFGGKEALIGEFPHMALLGYQYPPKWRCGGSLISEQFVLTAAHCLSSRDEGNLTTVRLGELNIKEHEPNAPHEDFGIAETFKHPSYTRPKVDNDIALIRLSRTVIFTPYKRPACLWTKHELSFRTTIATGWGTTEFDTNSVSDVMRKVGLNIIDNNDCQNMFTHYFDRKLSSIARTMICARNTTHLGDTCAGDSGGPIQVTSPNNKCVLYIIGVTAVGKTCGGNLPGIYTRVSEYINWIERIVWP